MTLLPLAPEHAPALFPLLNDWDVVRMLAQVPWPIAPGDVEAHARRSSEEGAESDDFAIVVEETIVGCASIKRIGTGNPPRQMPRLGFWIGRRYWNRGYGRQVVAKLVERAFRENPGDRIGAGVFHDNPASRHVLEIFGFEKTGRYETYSLARGVAVLTSDMQLSRARWRGAEA